MNSLATLSAEKSRMEASFQADKKNLRSEMFNKDKTIKELTEKVKVISSQTALEVEKYKSKIIVERHEREKSHNDQMVMVRELQKLLSDERHLKENLEMQLNDLKTQFSKTNYSDRTIKELAQELDQTKKKLKNLESNKGSLEHENATTIFYQLQNELSNLKQQHSIAIKNEQQRAFLAEERSKNLAELHEERVANLESRLAELSQTVGTYDRLRNQDQENIAKLKEQIAQMSLNHSIASTPQFNLEEDIAADNEKSISSLIEEILYLKNILLLKNAKLTNPLDISDIFSGKTKHTEESKLTISLDEYNSLKHDYEMKIKELLTITETLKLKNNHIKNLQEKIKVLNKNIEEHELELKNKSLEYITELKLEKNKSRDMINSMESDFRSKTAQLEQQLHKQRDRSLVLLEEKENEIKTLKTSFELFIPTSSNEVIATSSSDEESTRREKSHLNKVLNPSGTNSGASSDTYHMLHYVHELARKDVEISNLRKAKHSAESSLRQALQDSVKVKQEMFNRINLLEETVDRLERCKSREGENLEYLKNVVLSYLVSNDTDGKRLMLNAIGAVLKFNPSEMMSISNFLNGKTQKK